MCIKNILKLTHLQDRISFQKSFIKSTELQGECLSGSYFLFRQLSNFLIMPTQKTTAVSCKRKS